MSQSLLVSLPVRERQHNGFKWSFDDNGAHHFVKEVKEGYRTMGYLEMRCLPSDMENGNFEIMADNVLTNTNKVPKRKTL